MFTYFFVAVLQSSYLCLLLCCCFAVLHLAFASDPARFTSVLRMSLVLTPQTPPSPGGARGRGTRLELCLVWFGNEKRGRCQNHMTYCLATSPKSTQILSEILPLASLALLLKIEAGTFCLSIFLGDCLYTNLMRSRLAWGPAWVFDGGAKNYLINHLGSGYSSVRYIVDPEV